MCFISQWSLGGRRNKVKRGVIFSSDRRRRRRVARKRRARRWTSLRPRSPCGWGCAASCWCFFICSTIIWVFVFTLFLYVMLHDLRGKSCYNSPEVHSSNVLLFLLLSANQKTLPHTYSLHRTQNHFIGQLHFHVLEIIFIYLKLETVIWWQMEFSKLNCASFLIRNDQLRNSRAVVRGVRVQVDES